MVTPSLARSLESASIPRACPLPASCRRRRWSLRSDGYAQTATRCDTGTLRLDLVEAMAIGGSSRRLGTAVTAPIAAAAATSTARRAFRTIAITTTLIVVTAALCVAGVTLSLLGGLTGGVDSSSYALACGKDARVDPEGHFPRSSTSPRIRCETPPHRPHRSGKARCHPEGGSSVWPRRCRSRGCPIFPISGRTTITTRSVSSNSDRARAGAHRRNWPTPAISHADSSASW